MGWNGSGGFNRTQDFTADKNAGPPDSIVSAEKVDDEFNNFKTGLQNTLTRDGQNSPSANINFAGKKITNLGAPSLGGDAVNKTYADGLLASASLGNTVTGFSAVTPTISDEILIADESDSSAGKKASIGDVFALLTGLTPAGAVVAFAGPSAPTGWLFCGGQAVSRTTYADLYSAIGTTYGSGDGSTTFNLPDLRGRTLFGKDDMGGSAANRVTSGVSGVDGATLGASGGDQRMQQHNHTANVTDPGHSHNLTKQNAGGATPVPSFGTGSSPSDSGYDTDSATTGISVAIVNSGSGSSQNMPPAIILNWIIKT